MASNPPPPSPPASPSGTPAPPLSQPASQTGVSATQAAVQSQKQSSFSKSEVLSGLTGIAALVVAFLGWLTADRQADIAEQQTNLASATLNFSIDEANDSEIDMRNSLKIASRSANAAVAQSSSLEESLKISRDQNAISASALGRFRAATFLQARVAAITRYNIAYGRLDAEFQTVLAELAQEGYEFELYGVDAITLQDARKIATITRPTISAFREYAAEVNNARGVWSKATDKKVTHAYEDGQKALECFTEAGRPPLLRNA